MLMARKKTTQDFGGIIPPEQLRRRAYAVEVIDHPTRKGFMGETIKQRSIRKETILRGHYGKGRITWRQLKAGERLADDYGAAMTGEAMAVDTTKVNVDGGYPMLRMSERKEEARRSYAAAMAAVGPIASNEVAMVCCEDQPAGKGSAMEILRRGLDVLVRHYGY